MTRADCDVCRHPAKRFIDLSLAKGRAVPYIARRSGVSQRRIIRHRERCLEGAPLRAVAEQMGFKLREEEEVAS